MRKIFRKFSVIQYTKVFVNLVTLFSVIVVLLCIYRNNHWSYSLATTTISMMWKIGVAYMMKALIETALEKKNKRGDE